MGTRNPPEVNFDECGAQPTVRHKGVLIQAMTYGVEVRGPLGSV